MAGILKGLKPESVFGNFEALTQIPRESGNEQAVSDYLVKFGEALGLEVIQEECLNVIIKKKGSPGYENAPHVILQGHMDMVCVKEDEIEFDFLRDPIPLVVEGDYVKTKGTTLGADNGIAVAMAMAVLESNELQHPPLTALFTVAEETGMDGVIGLKSENVSGDILINIDSEEEGTLLASCAGGVNTIVTLKTELEAVDCASYYELKIKGLLGGHSGMEINQNRANALKLMGRVLEELHKLKNVHILKAQGGDKMNAIAKYAELLLGTNGLEFDKLKRVITEIEDKMKSEFESSDAGLEITLEPVQVTGSNNAFTQETVNKMITILRLMPYGVQTMSANIKGLVESSNNIGVMTMYDDRIEFSSAVRSSVKSLKDEINGRIQLICDLTGAKMELVSDYPEWPYKVNSKIRDLMGEIWKDMYGTDIKVDAIHAGLECGLLKEKVGDIDMISLGPNLYDVHTPMERMSIGSVERVYAFLTEVLKAVK